MNPEFTLLLKSLFIKSNKINSQKSGGSKLLFKKDQNRDTLFGKERSTILLFHLQKVSNSLEKPKSEFSIKIKICVWDYADKHFEFCNSISSRK